MGNPREVVAAQCALVEEHKDELVTKTIEQYTSVVIVQTPKVAPEPEVEAEPAAGEKPEPNHVNKPADIEEGKEVDELGDETKEENANEITEKINGVGMGKEDDAAEEKPESDEKNGEEEAKAEANADGKEEEKTKK